MSLREIVYGCFKRTLDLSVGLALLFVLSPAIFVVALLVRIKLGRPVFFRQVRPGLHGIPFTIFKFRSMSNAVDSAGRPLPDGQRLGTFGKRLRAWSLDELPQLFNVVKGDLSLVGPRPLLMDYLPLYSSRQAKRHLVKPGITGLAQVSGRNSISWEERFELDVWYVEHRSIALDLTILFRTVRQVFLRHGVSEHGQATMSPFTGNGRNITNSH